MSSAVVRGVAPPWREHAHRAYLVGVWVKGVHGALDVLVAIVVLVAPQLVPSGLFWVSAELGDDVGAPTAIVAGTLRSVGTDVLGWPAGLLAAFLLVHGAVKLASAICLLRRLLRGYPWAIAALVALLAYQIVDAAVTGSLTMALLAVVDIAVIALVLREFGQLRAERLEREPAA
ncbi:MAG TPA: DUF2127 domain-containing protein [Amnibacterium sp.]|nr:DUF2127 domain-containing protein [Amnibacterium sp.]